MTEKKRALNSLLLVLAKRNQQDLQYFLIVFNKIVVPLSLVGYEMIIANLDRHLSSHIQLALVE